MIVRDGAAPELYEVAADPAEQQDLAGSRPEELARLQAELEAVELGMGALKRGEEASLDPQTREVLNSLGYGGGRPR
ncbi:MAG: hypothetical protein ACPGPE_07645 [Planctomycetota bacterium]